MDLAAVHTEAYLNAVETGEPTSLASSNGLDRTPGLYEAAFASSQGAAQA